MAIDNLFSLMQKPSRQQITGAIRQAADATGANFEYLLTTAKIESNFNPRASASTSSARGLFQFIEQTWLGTVKAAGAALGFGDLANAITRSASGQYSVDDPSARADILKLREDPSVSAAMAGVLTRSNEIKLGRMLGREPNDAELYIAHFMGVGAAGKLITSAQNTPGVSGAALFPAAAEANRSIFYDRSGAPRSVQSVYANLTSRYAAAAGSQATRLAAGDAASDRPAAAAVDNAAYLASFPQARNTSGTPTPLLASVDTQSPSFRSLFQGGDRAEPVSPAIQDLWGRRTASAEVRSPVAERWPVEQVRAQGQQSAPLDLFSDRFGRFSS
ncbi:MAG TPA: transglycosylase SLT domain-containing protein [Xanthobacteraceae bacterium]|nr:transglycosylase SLT domain-containing protein [Xanthobacteraceae bacterium]